MTSEEQNLDKSAKIALFALLACTAALHAQDAKDAEQKLKALRGELKDVAQQRRKLDDQRGDASRKLRDADEKVGKSSRTLSQTEVQLKLQQQQLDALQQQRAQLQSSMQRQREELATLLRSAYLQGQDAPLKSLLEQDKVADANRVLAYHRYIDRDRAQKIAALSSQLEQLTQVEQEIQAHAAALDAARKQQQQQVASLNKERQARASLVDDLEQQYQDKAQREKALGADAKALETLLANLRAAAARAEAERRAAAQRAAAQAARDKAAGNPVKTPPPKTVASAPALKVGGLGWPVSGNLLAKFGGTLPDGHASSGVLIGAPLGSSVTAVADGTVVFSEWMTGYGLILIIDHGNGYMSLYAHNESLLHDAGDVVHRGDAVAKVGNSGGFGQPALYFELRRDGQPVDPSSWLQRR